MSSSISLPGTVAIAFAAQFLFVLFLFIGFLYLLIKLSRLSYKGLSALVQFLPGSLTIRLISISIAAWLFPDLLKFLLFLVFNLFSFFFIDLPKTLLPALKTASGQQLTKVGLT